jgi:Tol biopolymer transport system component
MQKKNLVFILVIGTLMLSSCTVDLSQQTPGASGAQAGGALSTPGSMGITPLPQSTSPSSAFPIQYLPVTWSGLNLTGKLVFIVASVQGNNPQMEIQELDLGTGEITTIFQAPSDGWIYSAVVSPDYKQIVMAYSLPAAGQALYILPIDGSQPPQMLFPLPTKDDQYLEPAWSPDGKYLYFVHANYALPPQEPNQHYPIFEIDRMAYPNGQLEKLIEKAYWPRLSADGSRLVYVSENPDDGTNNLFLANPDGSNASQVVMSGPVAPNIIDAPIFSPDGQSILFSAPVPAQSSAPTWLDRLFGAIPASAHSVPSEWWSVPLGGGAATQLTHIQAPGLYASISPDNQHIASFSGNGIYVMDTDGSGLTMVLSDVGGILGTVNWIQ